MKFSKKWLDEWLEAFVPTERLVEQFNMSGLEVESVETIAADFNGIVVGDILTVEDHPNADKLHICKVNVGQEEPLTIVCGAPNVNVGMKAPTALIGAVLPGIIIKPAKLRGIDSFGMMCSAKELGLAETSSGLLELPNDAPIGEDIRKYLNLDDQSIDVALTPNRGDCASIEGVAREAAALNRCEIKSFKINAVKPSIKDNFKVRLTAPEACPHYVGRVIKGVNLNAKTPLWMKEKLRRSGIRSIAPVVDVTNYLLIEFGQPMHAFDLSKLSKVIDVRFAHSGEKIVVLSGDEINLSEDTLIIADSKKPLAIAGVMGGLDSGVTDQTTDIFLESAFFNPLNIANKARQYNLTSESAYRFERGVDISLQVKAIERATQLLIDIVGGESGPIIEKTNKKNLPKINTIELNFNKIHKIIGYAIPEKEILSILNYLGMKVTKKSRVLKVIPPSYRFDIHLDVDLIEEIARVFGYNNIPVQHYQNPLKAFVTTGKRISINRLKTTLQDKDYHEVISYSFIDAKDQQLFDPNKEAVSLLNPLSSEMGVMRSCLWPSLVNTLIYNLNRQHSRVRLFENGLRFYKEDNQIKQEPVISGLIYGNIFNEQWGEKNRPVDFFDLKSDVENLLSLTGEKEHFHFVSSNHPACHPKQCAAIYKENILVGYVGTLHPLIAQQKEIPGNVFLFELLVGEITEKELPTYSVISKFPTVRRDIALLIDQQVQFADIKNAIQKEIGKLLANIVIFDVYQGKNIENNKKSIALGLTFQDPSRTLNDSEVNEIVKRVIVSLEHLFGAILRA